SDHGRRGARAEPRGLRRDREPRLDRRGRRRGPARDPPQVPDLVRVGDAGALPARGRDPPAEARSSRVLARAGLRPRPRARGDPDRARSLRPPSGGLLPLRIRRRARFRGGKPRRRGRPAGPAAAAPSEDGAGRPLEARGALPVQRAAEPADRRSRQPAPGAIPPAVAIDRPRPRRGHGRQDREDDLRERRADRGDARQPSPGDRERRLAARAADDEAVGAIGPETMPYQDFHLDFVQARDGGIRIRVIGSPAGDGAEARFEAPGIEGEVAILAEAAEARAEAERAGRGEEAVERLSAASLRALGAQLFDRLIAGEVRSLYDESVGRLGESGDGLRIELRLPVREKEIAGLHALPWELLTRLERDHPLGLDRRFSIVRYLPQARAARPPLPERLRILCASASPSGSPPLDLEREMKEIGEALGAGSGK